MKKTICLLFVLFTTISLFSQESNSKFEVHTSLKFPRTYTSSRNFVFNKDSIKNRISSIPDTATTNVTFVYSSSLISSLDSVRVVLNNSQNQEVLSEIFAVSNLKNEGKVRIDGATIFINVGAYPFLKHFVAYFTPIYSDRIGEQLTFTKH